MQVKYDSLKVLVVGCGSIGRRHMQVLTEIGVTQIAGCDSSSVQREQIRKLFPEVNLYTNYGQSLDEWAPDAVFILTPTSMHLSMATEALVHNAHVFIEKPLSNTSIGVDELEDLAAKKNLKVMIGFCFRYHEVILRAKKFVEEGAIGRIINIRAHMGEHFPTVQPNYLNMYYAKYSGAFELVHDLDLAIWLANQSVEETYGVFGSYSDIGIEAPDSVDLLLKFEDRLVSNIHLDFFQKPRRRSLEIIGTTGIVIVEFSTWEKASLAYYAEEAGEWITQEFSTKRNDMFRDEDTEFLQAILTDKPISCSIAEALKSIEVIEQVYRPIV